MTRHLTLLLLILSTLLLSSCTAALWRKDHNLVELTGIYLNPSRGDMIIAVEDNAAYVFKLSNQEMAALLLVRELESEVSFSDFNLTTRQGIVGQVSFAVSSTKVDSDMQQRLQQNGFMQDEAATWQRDLKLSGKRYTVEGELPWQPLTRPYFVTVIKPHSFDEIANKIVATPGAIVYDAAVVLPATIVMFTLTGVLNMMD
ncbi:MAG: hypothetical protein HWE13_07880 [Gammaproteobacteria bacterium]|nr:hypothetical protein [Gammaproteobacteria bacterium]NVK88030.1 hypothetical protein [Gammaproteobacteria bacterium]